MIWVRTATRNDLPAIRKILVETWHATYDEIYGVERVNEICGDWHSLEALEENLERPHSEFLVADDGNAPCGMAYASQSEKTINLHQLYVLPEFHGQRAGLQLLVEIENSFMDCNEIALEVEENNKRAVDFYTVYGFQDAGKTTNCGKDGSGIPALILKKQIVYAED